jgi:aspartate/methionine/tyrosine aminotransferase
MPPHVVEAAARAAERAPYAPTRGLPALREAVAAEHGVDPERNVLVTLGGMQGLYLAARAFGTRTVSHAPSFFFPQLIEAAGGMCTVAYGWDEYAAAIGPETTLAIVNTPVNPTGYVFPARRSRRDRRRSLADRRAVAERRGVLRRAVRRARAPLAGVARRAA